MYHYKFDKLQGVPFATR